MQNPNDPLIMFWEEFVYLRQHGTNRDEAWYQILEKVKQDARFQDKDTNHLLNLATNWERREGHKYHYRNGQVGAVTQIDPPAHQPTRNKLPRPLIGTTGELNPAILREYERKRMEEILDGLETLPKASPNAPALVKASLTALSPAYFDEYTVLLIFAKDYAQPLQVRFKSEAEQLIGRVTSKAAINPQIDLTQFGGEAMGVSRMHAAIMLQNNALLLADIGSTNGTYINGKSLVAQEIYTVQDRDEVRFGHLICRLRFHRRE